MKISNILSFYNIRTAFKALFFPWFLSPLSIFHRSFARETCPIIYNGILFDFDICQVHVMHCIPKFPPYISLIVNLTAPLSVDLRSWPMSAGSFSWRRLHIPWGGKKKSRESKLPRVSANLCYLVWDTYMYLGTGKFTWGRPNNNTCWEFYGA